MCLGPCSDGDLCPRGLCPGGLCQGDPPTPPAVTSGRYAEIAEISLIV